jgi:hypothetical protein
MFPDGLTFEPARTPDGARQIWKISGEADFAHTTETPLGGQSRFRLGSDPNGIWRGLEREVMIDLVLAF